MYDPLDSDPEKNTWCQVSSNTPDTNNGLLSGSKSTRVFTQGSVPIGSNVSCPLREITVSQVEGRRSEGTDSMDQLEIVCS